MLRDFWISELRTLLNSVTPSILCKNLISDLAFVIAFFQSLPKIKASKRLHGDIYPGAHGLPGPMNLGGPWNSGGPSSSVRRILKREGGQKIWEEQSSELEIVPLKFSPIFRPKLGEEQNKKRSSIKKKRSSSFVWSNLTPNLQRGGAMPQVCLLF